MIEVWQDPGEESRRSQSLRDITARLLIETDQTEIYQLIGQLSRLVEAHLRAHPPN